MSRVTRECLSDHDKAILDTIFNPVQTENYFPVIFDVETSADLRDPVEPQTPQVQESIKIEMEGITKAHNGDYITALKFFDEALNHEVSRASVYNNRAQVHRLMGNDNAAFLDLSTAIELANEISLTACQAHCQRGVLYRKCGNVSAARNDFEKAAKLGSKFARNQLVELNPYAALCNQMLGDIFEKLSTPENNENINKEN